MASATDNFNLPLYDTGDPANLRDQYNSAMGIIDGEMKTAIDNTTTALDAANEAETAAGNAQTAASIAQSTANDAVGRLNALGATDNTKATQLKAKIDTTATDLNALESTFSRFKTDVNVDIEALRDKDTEIEGDIAKVNASLTALHADTAANAGNLYDKITQAASNTAVLLGDSYSAASFTSETGVWWKTVADVTHWDIKNYSAGGAGYYAGTKTFSAQLADAVADGSFSNDSVVAVMVFGYLNDYNSFADASDYIAKVSSLINSAKSSFPNATVYIIGPNCWQTFNARHGDNNTGSNADACYAFEVACRASGAVYINTLYAMWGRDEFFQQSGSSHVGHPTQLGQRQMGYWVAQAMIGSEQCNVPFIAPQSKEVPITVSGGSGSLRLTQNGDRVYCIAKNVKKTDATGNLTVPLPLNYRSLTFSGYYQAIVVSAGGGELKPVSVDGSNVTFHQLTQNSTYNGIFEV